MKSHKFKILYQPYQYRPKMKTGAFKYIEKGYIHGFVKAGAEIAIWDGYDFEKLQEILSQFLPNLFVGYLRGGAKLDYKNFEWTNNNSYELLLNYRKATGMKVALHSHPDVQKMVKYFNLKLNFEEPDPSFANKFYNHIPPPLPAEEQMIDDQFIDVIIHCFSKEISRCCFDYWRKNGIPVIEEPLAADDAFYHPPIVYRPELLNISFIGGWWPFKAKQLDRYIQCLSEGFQKNIYIYGSNWPYLSRGHISDRKYREVVWASKINLVFHEPSQVQNTPIHVNERIFKIYAMKKFVICDNNLCLHEYFDEDEIILCSSPEEMLDKCNFFLKPCNSTLRKQYSMRGYQAIKSRHTYMHRAKNLFTVIDGMR